MYNNKLGSGFLFHALWTYAVKHTTLQVNCWCGNVCYIIGGTRCETTYLEGELHEWVHMQQRTKKRIGVQTKQVVDQLKIITQVWLQAIRHILTSIDNIFCCFALFAYCVILVLLFSPIARSPWPTIPSLLSFSLCPRSLCVRDAHPSSFFLDSWFKTPVVLSRFYASTHITATTLFSRIGVELLKGETNNRFGKIKPSHKADKWRHA